MTEKDLIKTIQSAIPDCTEKAAKHALKSLFRAIADEIALSPEGVRLREIGTLRRVAREAKPGRNPRTGEAIELPARYAVHYAAGLHLKQRLAALAPPSFAPRRFQTEHAARKALDPMSVSNVIADASAKAEAAE